MASRKGAHFFEKTEIHEDFVNGDKRTIETLIVNIYHGNAAPEITDEALQVQLAEYRRYLQESYKYLDFKGIDSLAEVVTGSSGLALESVYVPLRARPDLPGGESWHRIGGRYYRGAEAIDEKQTEALEQRLQHAEQSALPVEQWIQDRPALVILGDPGSGKSTSLKRLALGFAQREDGPLPILLPLNTYSKALEQQPISLEDFLPRYFHGQRSQLETDKLKRLFQEALKQERAVILNAVRPAYGWAIRAGCRTIWIAWFSSRAVNFCAVAKTGA